MKNTKLDFICIEIENEQEIPIEYTGYGKNISPEFIIKNLSPEAKTIAVTLEDLSHPIKNFTHWIIWNIPACNIIEKGISPGRNVLGSAKQGIGYGFHRYAGPKPPKGKKHIYRFTVYTLDCELDLGADHLKSAFLKKSKNHIIQSGSVTAAYIHY